VDGDYTTVASGTCASGGDAEGVIMSATECFNAAQKVGVSGNVDTVEGTNLSLPAGCSLSVDDKSGAPKTRVFFNKAPVATAAKCGAGVNRTMANGTSLVNVQLNVDAATDKATITLTGPSDAWFGWAPNAQAMKDEPWAVIVEATNGGQVSERKLKDQSGGTVLKPSVTVVSSAIHGALRTVVLTRPLKGLTADHYTFSVADTMLPFINAVGSGQALRTIKTRTSTNL
jgi:hypothetical protein